VHVEQDLIEIEEVLLLSGCNEDNLNQDLNLFSDLRFFAIQLQYSSTEPDSRAWHWRWAEEKDFCLLW
jgi:hypothetical protein